MRLLANIEADIAPLSELLRGLSRIAEMLGMGSPASKKSLVLLHLDALNEENKDLLILLSKFLALLRKSIRIIRL